MPRVHTLKTRHDLDSHMTEKPEELEWYIEWLSTPKSKQDPKTQTAVAKHLGVSITTLRNWRLDPRISTRVSQKVLSVLTVNDFADVVGTMKIIATDPTHRSCIAAGKELLALMEKTQAHEAPIPLEEMTKKEVLALVAQVYDVVDDLEDSA